MIIISALTIGFIGSFHCAGMCGPIALALPIKNENRGSLLISILLYNLGRICTYSLIGLVAGLAGKGVHLSGFQQYFSIIIGSIMILSVMFPVIFKKKIVNFPMLENIKNRISKNLSVHSIFSLFLIGFLNGLLPCGLVYLAVAVALTSTGTLTALLAMAAFGVATIPIMAAISLLGNFISNSTRKIIYRAIPFIVIIIGTLFILRGLDLGIKYISPSGEMLAPHHASVGCCKKK